MPSSDTQWKPGGRRGNGHKPKGFKKNPLTYWLSAELNYKPKANEGGSGHEWSRIIVRRLIRIATDTSLDPSYNIQAAKELRELGYSEWGKPTQPIDTGFDLGTMIASVAYAVKNPT